MRKYNIAYILRVVYFLVYLKVIEPTVPCMNPHVILRMFRSAKPPLLVHIRGDSVMEQVHISLSKYIIAAVRLEQLLALHLVAIDTAFVVDPGVAND